MCPVISLANSTFNDPATKQGTARIVGWKHMGVANSLTLEISMGGGGGAGSMSPWAGLQLNPHHYRSIGSGLVNALVAFVTAADPPSPDAWVVPEWIIKVRGLGFESLDFFIAVCRGANVRERIRMEVMMVTQVTMLTLIKGQRSMPMTNASYRCI